MTFRGTAAIPNCFFSNTPTLVIMNFDVYGLEASIRGAGRESDNTWTNSYESNLPLILNQAIPSHTVWGGGWIWGTSFWNSRNQTQIDILKILEWNCFPSFLWVFRADRGQHQRVHTRLQPFDVAEKGSCFLDAAAVGRFRANDGVSYSGRHCTTLPCARVCRVRDTPTKRTRYSRLPPTSLSRSSLRQPVESVVQILRSPSFEHSPNPPSESAIRYWSHQPSFESASHHPPPCTNVPLPHRPPSFEYLVHQRPLLFEFAVCHRLTLVEYAIVRLRIQRTTG
jgi:hypothetical protein